MSNISSMGLEEAAQYAASLGLKSVNKKFSLINYVREIWTLRHFTKQLAVSKIIASTSQNRLGLFWEFLNPLFTAGMYYLAFGVLLGTRRDSPNFIFFLIAGVLTFNLFQQGFLGSAKSILKEKGLAKNLTFPLIIIPISATFQATLRSLPTLSLFYPVAYFTGIPFSWKWLLLPFVMFLTILFGASLGTMLSRVLMRVRDFVEALPLFTRALMFTSGIFFDVTSRFDSAPEPIRSIALNGPVGLLLDIARGLFIPEDMPSQNQILLLIAATVVLFTVSLTFFWRGEMRDAR